MLIKLIRVISNVLLLLPFISYSQAITLENRASESVCAGAPYRIAFTTSGTFAPGNTFRVQLSSTPGVYTDVPGAFTGNSVQITLPSPGGAGGTVGYTYRIVSDKPVVYSTGGNYLKIVKPAMGQLTGSNAGSDTVNPYTTVNLKMTLTGGSPYTATTQNGVTFTQHNEYVTFDNNPVTPPTSTTYTLTSVRNACGVGSSSGSVVVNVNPIGIRILAPRTYLCLGSSLPVYFSTDRPLPPNTTFEAELISTRDNNQSVTVPVSGTGSPLSVSLPSQLPATSAEGYKLRIYSRTAGISTWYQDERLLTLNAPPRLSLTTPSPTVPFGGQMTLLVSQTATGGGNAHLSDGRSVYLSGTTSIPLSVPAKATSYSLTGYDGTCDTQVRYGNRAVAVQYKPGVRFDSLSANEVCAGQTVRLYYTTAGNYTLSRQLQVRFGYNSPLDVRQEQPGQLAFTVPASFSATDARNLGLWQTSNDSLLMTIPTPFRLKTRPTLSYTDRTEPFSTPVERAIPAIVLGGGVCTIRLNTGASYEVNGGYYAGYSPDNNVGLPVYVGASATYSITAVSNECGVGTIQTPTATVRYVIDQPAPVSIGIRAVKTSNVLNCPGSRQTINLFVVGAFEADNQFQLEISDAAGNYSGTPVLTITDAKSLTFVWPGLSERYRVRVSSTKPIARSNDLLIDATYQPPSGFLMRDVAQAVYGPDAMSVLAGEGITTYLSINGTRPLRYELLDGTRGIIDDPYLHIDYITPTRNMTLGIKSVVDGCGVPASASALRGTTQVTVVPALILTSKEPSQVCAETPTLIPFRALGNIPANASYMVQTSPDTLTWQTVPSTYQNGQLMARFPASLVGRSQYHRVVGLVDGALIPGSVGRYGLYVSGASSLTLSSFTSSSVVSIEQGSSTTNLKVMNTGAPSSLLVSNGTQVAVGYAYANQVNTVQVSSPGVYSIVSAYNGCGYAQTQGEVRVTTKPYLVQATVNKTRYCRDETVNYTYEVGGELEAGNKVRIYLTTTNGVGAQRVLLSETTTLNGTYSFSISPSLGAGYYSLEAETSAPASLLNRRVNFTIEQPVSLTLLNQTKVVYSDVALSLPVLTSGGPGSFSLTLSGPGGTSVVAGPNYEWVLSRSATGTYTAVATQHTCGAGTATGSVSLSVLPASSVKIHSFLPASPAFCIGKPTTIYVETTGTFSTTNVFTAYLYDSTGTAIRSLPTQSSPNQLTIAMPSDLPIGMRYLLRVGSSSPQHLGATADGYVVLRATASATITGNAAIIKGDSIRLSVALTGTPPWQFTITDFFGPRAFTTSQSPYMLTVRPDTTIGYRLTEVRNAECGAGVASGTALITVSPLLANEPLVVAVQVWPNPTVGLVQVSGMSSGNQAVVLRLHTLAGELVQQQTLSVPVGAWQQRLDLSQLPGGVYLLSVEQDGRRAQFKVVRQ